METKSLRVIGILIKKDCEVIKELQDILSSFGNVIRSRLGLSDPANDDTIHGLMLLELKGSENEKENLITELQGLQGIQVQQMIF